MRWIQELAINLIIAVTAITALFGGIQFIKVFLDYWLGVGCHELTTGCGLDRRSLASSLAVLIVAKPTFLVFWKMSGRNIWR